MKQSKLLEVLGLVLKTIDLYFGTFKKIFLVFFVITTCNQ